MLQHSGFFIGFAIGLVVGGVVVVVALYRGWVSIPTRRFFTELFWTLVSIAKEGDPKGYWQAWRQVVRGEVFNYKLTPQGEAAAHAEPADTILVLTVAQVGGEH